MSSFDDFCRLYCAPPNSPLSLDLSFSGIDKPFLDRMEPEIQRAFAAMDALESGAIANPDENRMVGHYWLRDLDRLPDPDLRARVRSDNDRIYRFLADVREGKAAGKGGRFTDLLSIGIGGSALGPQLVVDAVGDLDEGGLQAHFLDNTDPDGIARVLESLAGRLDRTLCVVISKSGGTPETRNGMLLAEEAYRRARIDFGPHAVAITGEGSKLDQYAQAGKWLARFPMYDWVGGRTSVMSAVGLLPCGLAGVDLSAFLAGAAVMDAATRSRTTRENPAALLALYWHHATNGRGEKDMVVLPYRDRLLLFSRYLQQLVMESLGKEHDLDGNVVEQGIAVYGNKGSTDQHAYVQQLRDGVANFFVVFIESLRDGDGTLEVDPQVTAGDYLSGFFQGTRRALAEKNRPSATITVEDVTAYTLGALIALFERAVGFYATLVNINAYHQPGVEAGKKGAAAILETQKKLLGALARTNESATAAQWADTVGCDPVDAFYILRHLAKNDRGVKMEGRHPSEAAFSAG